MSGLSPGSILVQAAIVMRGLEWPQSPAGLDIGAGTESDERASVAGLDIGAGSERS